MASFCCCCCDDITLASSSSPLWNPGVDGPYVDWHGVDGPYVDWPGVAGLNMSLSRSTLPTDWGCWKSSPRSWYLKQKLLEDRFEMQAGDTSEVNCF